MQSLTGSATSPAEPIGQDSVQAEPAAAPSSLIARLSRALKRALLRVRPVAAGHAQPAPVAARTHTTIMPRHERRPAEPSRAQHQMRADAARAAHRLQQPATGLHAHHARGTVPFADSNRWMAVCDAVAGWQQEMVRRVGRYNGPLLPNVNRPTEQGLALTATRMLLAMQQKSRHLVLDSIPVMRLPSALCNAEQLEVLTVHDCDVFEWPASGGLPPNLTSLHFSRNRRMTAIPGRMGQLQQLRELVILDSPLRALPTAVSQLPRLERLVLQGSDLRIVPVELGALQRLLTLTLANGRLLTQLPNSLGQLQQLRHLSLRGNPVLPVLPETVGQLSVLESLDLRDNTGMAVLPRSLGSLRRLRHLDCSGMSALASLPAELGACTSLRTLRLRDCVTLRSLPATLGGLKRLTHLDLRGCLGLTDLPETLRSLPAACQIDVPPHLLERLAERRRTITAPAVPLPNPGEGADWVHLLQNWRTRLGLYDAEYGSDAFRIWVERSANAAMSDEVRSRRDGRRLGFLVDGLCNSATLRCLVFQRAHERYALGHLDDEGLPLHELMALLTEECVRSGPSFADRAATLMRHEAWSSLLEGTTGTEFIGEAVEVLADTLPQIYADRHGMPVEQQESEGSAPVQRHTAVAQAWLHATPTLH
ncbi:leucine-rich repeat domain-containing protein [Ralstonia solanacearum]|uniref:Type III effector n=1 Tax=Ralstonia solanacearum K60 TaxID=1091042 RepID=A0AAP8D274_RALSL|nr:leucine-rich repeat domain-containing protein [Ralstonia solanacearum]MBT1539797.1 leucine-rich repeat domain-containing protein [Ralstonia solanacearum]OYQ09534.1 type III effector [Ralstonia solanacearum K60]QOK84031.1 leucine-rich repeat domain-containing protein [Ralstonia solanacearum]RIJ84451.1 leucine-rich repeat domain-containing protein [Ralstonia solanacearum]